MNKKLPAIMNPTDQTIIDRLLNELADGTPEDLNKYLQENRTIAKKQQLLLFTVLKNTAPSNTTNFKDKLQVMLQNDLKFDMEFFWRDLFGNGVESHSPACKWWLKAGWKIALPCSIGELGLKLEDFLDHVIMLATSIEPVAVKEILKNIAKLYPQVASKFDLREASRRRLWGRALEATNVGRREVAVLLQSGLALPENFNFVGPNGRHKYRKIGVKLACLLTDNDLGGAFDSSTEEARLKKDINHYQQELLEDGYLGVLMPWLTPDNFNFAIKTGQTKENVLHCLFHYTASSGYAIRISEELNNYVEQHAEQFLTEVDNSNRTCFETLSCGYDQEIIIEGKGVISTEAYRTHLQKLAMEQQIIPAKKISNNTVNPHL